MSRVITFSRNFPSYHPKKGLPTFFAEKLLNSFLIAGYSIYTADTPKEFLESLSKEMFHPKHHTIRAGNRWKAGDKFSPRVWSGKPYNSKQIILAPDIEIKNVYDISILGLTVWVNGKVINSLEYADMARHDGLSSEDLKSWFSKLPFNGQIICWNETIKY